MTALQAVNLIAEHVQRMLQQLPDKHTDDDYHTAGYTEAAEEILRLCNTLKTTEEIHASQTHHAKEAA